MMLKYLYYTWRLLEIKCHLFYFICTMTNSRRKLVYICISLKIKLFTIILLTNCALLHSLCYLVCIWNTHSLSDISIHDTPIPIVVIFQASYNFVYIYRAWEPPQCFLLGFPKLFSVICLKLDVFDIMYIYMYTSIVLYVSHGWLKLTSNK